VVPRAGEHVEHRALVPRGVKHAVRCEQWQAGRRRDVAKRIAFAFLAAAEVPLDFHEHAFLSKRRHEPRHARRCPEAVVAGKGAAQRPFLVPRERDKPRGELREVIPSRGGFLLRSAQFRARDELAEVAIAGARFHEHRQHAAVVHREFCADDGADAVLLCPGVKPRTPIDAVAVTQRHGGQTKFRRTRGEGCRVRCAAQEAARTAGVEFGVFHALRGLRVLRRHRHYRTRPFTAGGSL